MFLSKSRHGIYYVWFTDETGRRRKVSTRTKVKSDAYQALKNFSRLKKTGSKPIPFDEFTSELLRYASATYSIRTVDLYQRTFRFFAGIAFFATISRGLSTISATGSKSFNTSYCSL